MTERHSASLANVSQDARKPRCKSEREVRRTKHERRTDASSHPRGRMADFNLVNQQDVEPRASGSLKSTMNRGL
jgi:hypothetical protein